MMTNNMKQTIRIVKTYDIDIDLAKERKRIRKLFKGEMRDKLLEIIDEFDKGNYQKMNDLYDALPYDDVECFCPGQEFMGNWWIEICECRVIPEVQFIKL